MVAVALLFTPPAWAAIGAAAKWTAITLGVAGTAAATGYAINEMTREDDDEAAPTTDTRACETCEQDCPPCVPPVGTRQLKRIDRVPPSVPHWPCPGDHAHILMRNQNPRTCRCFWNRPAPPDDVICLPQGGDAPPGLFRS